MFVRAQKVVPQVVEVEVLDNETPVAPDDVEVEIFFEAGNHLIERNAVNNRHHLADVVSALEGTHRELDSCHDDEQYQQQAAAQRGAVHEHSPCVPSVRSSGLSAPMDSCRTPRNR